MPSAVQYGYTGERISEDPLFSTTLIIPGRHMGRGSPFLVGSSGVEPQAHGPTFQHTYRLLILRRWS